MKRNLFVQGDLDEETIHYIDRYIKNVIKSASIDDYRARKRERDRGITYVPLDDGNDPTYEEPGYEQISFGTIEVKNVRVSISNSELFSALQKLTEVQRSVLLQNTILHIPLKQIAEEWGIGERMAKKHKHNAIEIVKRSMSSYEKL